MSNVSVRCTFYFLNTSSAGLMVLHCEMNNFGVAVMLMFPLLCWDKSSFDCMLLSCHVRVWPNG